MASKYRKKFSLPENFYPVLENYAREVLRDQPVDIIEFSYMYFKALEEVSIIIPLVRKCNLVKPSLTPSLCTTSGHNRRIRLPKERQEHSSIKARETSDWAWPRGRRVRRRGTVILRWEWQQGRATSRWGRCWVWTGVWSRRRKPRRRTNGPRFCRVRWRRWLWKWTTDCTGTVLSNK